MARVAEGTTEALAKFWMPLEEFVTIVTRELVAGTPFIVVGRSAEAWNKYEKGKEEIVTQLWKAAF